MQINHAETKRVAAGSSDGAIGLIVGIGIVFLFIFLLGPGGCLTTRVAPPPQQHMPQATDK